MKSAIIWLILFHLVVDTTWAAEKSCVTLRSPDAGIVDSSTPNRDCENCKWNITVPEGKQIEIHVLKVNITNNPNCTTSPAVDYLVINETTKEKTKTLEFFCNNLTTSRIVRTETSTANITLHVSDKVKSESAFYFIYKAYNASEFVNSYCNKEFREPSGVIMSPNYPEAVPHAVDCTYKIIQPAGVMVRLSLVYLDIRQDGLICNNFLEIHDNLTAENQTLSSITKICDSQHYIPGYVFNSTANYVIVKLKTRVPLAKNRGFYAVYDTVGIECGGVRRDSNGTIQSPGFGANSNYSNNQNCTWKIIAPPGHGVLLKWKYLELDQNKGVCSDDYVAVSEVLSNGTGVIAHKYCGTNLPASYTSNNTAININFITDSRIVRKGFLFDYKVVNLGKLHDTL